MGDRDVRYNAPKRCCSFQKGIMTYSGAPRALGTRESRGYPSHMAWEMREMPSETRKPSCLFMKIRQDESTSEERAEVSSR